VTAQLSLWWFYCYLSLVYIQSGIHGYFSDNPFVGLLWAPVVLYQSHVTLHAVDVLPEATKCSTGRSFSRGS
jgi:hypothetical protein